MIDVKELERYQRQMVLDEVGYAGQKQLKAARLLCVGAGGLGSSLCLYLAAAGIGTIGIVDGDTVSLDNLHRQILYNTLACGQQKTKVAKLYLQKINPHCNIECHNQFLTKENAAEIMRHYDIIADCSDNFATRYLVNDQCSQLKKPNVFASVRKWQGYCTVFPSHEGPCYRCLFRTPPKEPVDNCAQAGVVGTVPGMLGILQANEVLKLVLEVGQVLIGRVLVFDALAGAFNFFNLMPSPDCPLCFQA